MLNKNLKIFEALTTTELSHIIPVIQKGLELEKLEFIVNKDQKIRDRIFDTELLLTYLHLRKFCN